MLMFLMLRMSIKNLGSRLTEQAISVYLSFPSVFSLMISLNGDGDGDGEHHDRRSGQ